MKRSVGLASVAALVLGACSSDGGSAKPKEVTDPQTLQSGKTAAQSTSALAALQVGADAQTARTPLSTVGTAIQSFAGQYQTYKASQRASGQGQVGLPLTAALEQAEEAAGATDTFEYQDGHLTADVHYAQDSGGSSVAINYVADMNITTDASGATFDGTFDIAYTGHNSQYDVDYSYDAVYDTLKLDTMSCPVSGGFSVDYSIKLSGPAFDALPAQARQALEQGTAGSGTVSVEFGPSCGDVKVEGT